MADSPYPSPTATPQTLTAQRYQSGAVRTALDDAGNTILSDAGNPIVYVQPNYFYPATVSIAGPAAPQTLIAQRYQSGAIRYVLDDAGRQILSDAGNPIAYVQPNYFYAATVAHAVLGQTLTPSLYIDPDSFGAAIIGRVRHLQPTCYVDPDSFGVAVIGRVRHLQAARYVDPDSFYHPVVVGKGPLVLLPTLYIDPDRFGRSTVQARIFGVIYGDFDTDRVKNRLSAQQEMTYARVKRQSRR
jgi:hypothetical protein